MSAVYFLVTFAIYFLLLMVVARVTGRWRGNEAFFSANRESPWPVVAFGMIGASLSGVSFVSVPGMVASTGFTYLQMCMGFFFGYIFIAHVLLPLYYRRRYISIYVFLRERFGRRSYRTGASFFLLSKLTGAAARLYLVCVILQRFVFDCWGVPFFVNVIVILLFVWLYTHRSGIRTIVWTDALQTFFLLAALAIMLGQVVGLLGLCPSDFWQAVEQSGRGRIFVFDDWYSKQNFFKQFMSGVFVTIVMTGLDQDTMQKNLTCRTLRESQKNMYCYGLSFLPINFLFLLLGAGILLLAGQRGDTLGSGDSLLPSFVAGGSVGIVGQLCFAVGITAAALSSVDSALTALTTSFCVDFLNVEHCDRLSAERRRKIVHIIMALLLAGCVLLFDIFNSGSLLDAVYTLVGYTYGPLLGLYAFGLFTKHRVADACVPFVCFASPLLCFLLSFVARAFWGYSFGYELLLLNGGLTFLGLRGCCLLR